ncbi:MAG: cell wall metabolism sensor histidine kinase WalK, partial [Oscillospiraceae bacterium]|jgi:two-component system sensor histidine kinase VicK|nr:cell wall metabolism sensor histidine kinase WalK [Oscillospiraceae bacterium]
LTERFSLNDSIKAVATAVALTAAQRGQTLTLSLGDNAPDILGDRARIEQVLMNIITNAVKYTQAGGRITVSSGAKDGFAWARIADTGIGIPESDIPHVFERFYRVEKARSREAGGTGLGLSIAAEIVKMHGGRIELESMRGYGSVFTVYLPLYTGESVEDTR